ncbi:MAG: glycosyltransferase family 4 protein [Verrucomicrobia bacterium]|nr:glycosyltransferase family 4 protein [Verrucomicrobiota bacterium]
MKIAHVNSSPGFSGGEVQVFLLLEGLRQRGHEVTLFAPPGSASEAEARQRNIPVRPYAPRGAADLFMMWRLRRALREGVFDLVHLHSGHAIWLGAMAARPLGMPIVATKRMDRRIRPGLKSLLIWQRWVDAAVAISPAVAELFHAARVPTARIHTICSVLDPARTRASRPRDRVRQSLACPPDVVALLSAGSLHQRKGMDVLLKALARLPDAPRHHLYIAGEGPERPALTQLAASLGLRARVSFLGQRMDTADLLNAADIFVIPSRSEGLGNAALEAMGCALPVVAGAVGGLRHVVADGTTGILVPPDNPDALAEALRNLIGKPQRRRDMGAAGRQRVTSHFTPSRW